MRKLCPYALAAGMDNVCPRSGMNALSRVTKSVIIRANRRVKKCATYCAFIGLNPSGTVVGMTGSGPKTRAHSPVVSPRDP